MKNQKILISSVLAIMFSLFFISCDKDELTDEVSSELQEKKVYQYLDNNGKISSFSIEGSTLTYTDKENNEISVEIGNDEVTGNPGNFRDLSISRVNGHLENDFRGSISMHYNNGNGGVVWQLNDDVFIRGDIECLNTVRDQIIIQVRITESNTIDPFAVGQSIVTTVRDLGNPGDETVDQIAKVILIYARPDECFNAFLPDVNDLIGYDDSSGNIVAD